MKQLSEFHRAVARLPVPPSPTAYFEGERRVHACSPDDILLFCRLDAHDLQRRSAESHLHRRFLLVSCLETGGTLSVDGIPFPLTPGPAHLVFPQSYHHFVNLAHSTLLWLMVTFETPEPERLTTLRQRTLSLADPDLDDLGAMVQRFQSPPAQGRGDALSATLSALLCRLCARVATEEPALTITPAQPYAGLWQRLQHELEHLPPEELRIVPLAKRLRISERHLREKFQTQFGVALGVYLRNYRIRRAIGLLTTSDLSLAEIADRCGYRSPASFHRAFQSHTGATPSSFRDRRPAPGT